MISTRILTIPAEYSFFSRGKFRELPVAGVTFRRTLFIPAVLASIPFIRFRSCNRMAVMLPMIATDMEYPKSILWWIVMPFSVECSFFLIVTGKFTNSLKTKWRTVAIPSATCALHRIRIETTMTCPKNGHYRSLAVFSISARSLLPASHHNRTYRKSTKGVASKGRTNSVFQ